MSKIAHGVMKSGGNGGASTRIFEVGVHDTLDSSLEYFPISVITFNYALFNSLLAAQQTALRTPNLYLGQGLNIGGLPAFDGPYGVITDVTGGSDKAYFIARGAPYGIGGKAIYEYGVHNVSDPSHDAHNVFKIATNYALYNKMAYNDAGASTAYAGITINKILNSLTAYGTKTDIV